MKGDERGDELGDERGDERDRDGARQEARGGGRISAAEWAVAAFGLLLVLGAVGYLLASAVRGGDARPRLAVRADSVVALAADAFVVPFTARNDGRETVAEVTVAGELRDGAGTETVRVLLDFLPAESERRGALVFTRDPRARPLRLRVESWREP